MILENIKGAVIAQEGQTESSIGMTLDLDSANILMQMLSKNLYSDGIGSAIRETCSNALDSHRRAGVADTPIVVGLDKNSYGTYEFSVEDFGLGLDDDDVKNVISKYGKSTKRNSATELGMFGLGFKAPLAYTSTFYFICRKNGMERKYMMYEGDDTNTIDMLYEKPTENPNGVKVIIPIKHHSDYISFFNKAKEQLAYFENVYFANQIQNDFKIFRHKDFQYSELATDNYVHLCLDNVYYNIDYSKLGISPISGKFALRFSLTDGIYPTPNREQIRYTKEVKELILKRISDLADFAVEKYNAQMKATDDVKSVYDHVRNSTTRYISLGENDEMRVDISGLIKYSNHKLISHPHLNGVKKLDLANLFTNNIYYILGEYQTKSVFAKGKLKSNPSSYFGLDANRLLNVRSYGISREFYLCNSELTSKQKKFLLEKSKVRGIEIILLKKHKQMRLRTLDHSNSYRSFLDLKNQPKDQWRTLITDFQFVVKSILDYTTKGKIEDAFLNEFKDEYARFLYDLEQKRKKRVTGVRTKKLQGELHYKLARPLERGYDTTKCKYEPKIMLFENRYKIDTYTVFGIEEDKDTLSKLYHILPKKGKQNIVIVTKKDYEILMNNPVHNWMNIKEFMLGNNKLFKRIATTWLIEKLLDSNNYLYTNVLSMYSPMEKVRNEMFIYREKYKSDQGNLFKDELLELAQKNNLFDMSIYNNYLRVKAFAEKFSWMNTLYESRYSWHRVGKRHDDKAYMTVCLFKYHKHRLNLEHYNIKK